jgi:hypothetical protein
MKIQSQAVSRLRVSHEYFEDGNWKGMNIFPSPESASRMAEKRLRLYAEPYGCTLVRDIFHYPGGFQPTASQEKPFSIRLILQPSYPAYQHFSHLPETDLLSETLYFSNISTKGESVHGFLSVESKVSQQDVRKLFQKAFHFRPGTTSDQQVEVLQSGQTRWRTYADQNGKVSIDLTAEEEGQFVLRRPGKADELFITSTVARKRYFAYVDLHFDPEGSCFKGEEVAEYKIAFPSREVYWKYHILPGDRLVSTMKVEDPDRQIHFEEMEVDEAIEAGQRTFISSRKLTIREFYPHAFKLVNGSSVLSERLPYPNLALMKKHSNEEGAFFMESFLSLT